MKNPVKVLILLFLLAGIMFFGKIKTYAGLAQLLERFLAMEEARS